MKPRSVCFVVDTTEEMAGQFQKLLSTYLHRVVSLFDEPDSGYKTKYSIVVYRANSPSASFTCKCVLKPITDAKEALSRLGRLGSEFAEGESLDGSSVADGLCKAVELLLSSSQPECRKHCVLVPASKPNERDPCGRPLPGEYSGKDSADHFLKDFSDLFIEKEICFSVISVRDYPCLSELFLSSNIEINGTKEPICSGAPEHSSDRVLLRGSEFFQPIDTMFSSEIITDTTEPPTKRRRSAVDTYARASTKPTGPSLWQGVLKWLKEPGQKHLGTDDKVTDICGAEAYPEEWPAFKYYAAHLWPSDLIVQSLSPTSSNSLNDVLKQSRKNYGPIQFTLWKNVGVGDTDLEEQTQDDNFNFYWEVLVKEDYAAIIRLPSDIVYHMFLVPEKAVDGTRFLRGFLLKKNTGLDQASIEEDSRGNPKFTLPEKITAAQIAIKSLTQGQKQRPAVARLLAKPNLTRDDVLALLNMLKPAERNPFFRQFNQRLQIVKDNATRARQAAVPVAMQAGMVSRSNDPNIKMVADMKAQEVVLNVRRNPERYRSAMPPPTTTHTSSGPAKEEVQFEDDHMVLPEIGELAPDLPVNESGVYEEDELPDWDAVEGFWK